MKILLIGAGGRECSLAWKISASQILEKLYVWPGNPMSKEFGEVVQLDEAETYDDLIKWAQTNAIDAVVCGPEQPLTEGLADQFEAQNIPVFGPKKEVAKLEGSKAFAKMVMAEAGIPTAEYKVVNSREDCKNVALSMLRKSGGTVIKASGLAGGKGVFVCRSAEDIENGLERLFSKMTLASETIVVEEILEGRECSFFTFLGDSGDAPLGFAVDFKRLLDGDEGPNTGGMGCYTPVEWLPENAEDEVNKKIIWPLLAALKKRNLDYRGCLYVGIMWGKSGPKVVEFNVRLGDPECQVLAVADERDWLSLIAECLGLKEVSSQSRNFKSSVCVVMASSTYPYGDGQDENAIFEHDLLQSADCKVFGASIEAHEGRIKTGGGRVFSVVASASSLLEARDRAYAHVHRLKEHWPACHVRSDIAKLAIDELSVKQ